MKPKETTFVRRFSRRQRIEHFAVMVLFTILAVTGLAQEFFHAGWAAGIIAGLGGIDRTRWIHRASGWLFTALALEHFANQMLAVMRGRARPSMVPNRKDMRDAMLTLRYYLRLSEEKAAFDRYDYRQKFEYWGLVLGGTIMILTGFMLLYPMQAARMLPGQLIPAAVIVHGYEGLLAFLVVITWHIFNAHLAPDVFPGDTSIFTGKISRERMQKEHPLEYARDYPELPAEAAEPAPEPALGAKPH